MLGAKHDVSYFVLGHFHHSPRAGITNLTRSVPAVVRFLNRWLQLLFPSCSWGSIAVSHNVSAAPHADLENSVESQNFTVSLGSFSGGGLWLAEEWGDIVMQGADGVPVRGVVHSTFQDPFAFDAHRLHATQPFTGDRWSVTAYANRHLLEVSGVVWDELRALGFPLPQPSAATRSVVLGPNPASVASPLNPPAELQPQEARVVQCEALVSLATSVHPVSNRSAHCAEAAHFVRQVHDCPPVPDVAQQLKAARPVVWRGAGDLIQVPWARAPSGKWLVLDLWSGFGGLCLACLSVGLHFWALAAECDAEAVACAAHSMPSVVHVPRVEDVSVQLLLSFLERRQIRGIIIGGGSPCQGNSKLNKGRRGLQDVRSQQPQLLSALVSSIREHEACSNLEVISFLENVASAPPSVVEQYSQWLDCQLARINAACCGWTQRDRLYWVAGNSRSLACFQGRSPDCWEWQVHATTHVKQLKHVGEKPVPAKIHCEQGFQILTDPKAVVQGMAPGMFPFTREFYHPDDGVQQASAQAVEPWMADARRFPPKAYEEMSLVWRGQEWRTPSSSERSQMLGIPPSATVAVPCEAALRTQRRVSVGQWLSPPQPYLHFGDVARTLRR